MTTQGTSQSLFAEDDDPRIVYSGEWQVVGAWSQPGEFGKTAHITTQQGASATLRFQGSGVRFYVSLPAITGERNGVMDLLVRLDGESIETQMYGRGTALAGMTPFVREGLDPLRVHEIIIVYQGRPQFGDPLPFRFDGIRWNIPAGPVGNSPSTGLPSSPRPSVSSSMLTSSSSANSESLLSTAEPSTTSQLPDPSPSPRSTGSSSIPGTAEGAPLGVDERTVTKILPQDRPTASMGSTGSLTGPTESGLSSEAGTPTHLPVGSVVAIAVSILVVLLLAGLGMIFVRQRKKRRQAPSDGYVTAYAVSEVQDGSQASLNGHASSSPHHPVVYQKEAFGSRNASMDWVSESTGSREQGLPPPAYTHWHASV